MKALSIRQPWAWIIIHGGKNVENRVWNYIPKLRGRIYIHAAKGMTEEEYEDGRLFAERVWESDGESRDLPPMRDLERGGIVGTAEIIGYLDNDYTKTAMYPWYLGDLGIVLSDPQPCEFRPIKGMLGFFEIP